jgi:two-component system response regulator PilR (NtrC family)
VLAATNRNLRKEVEAGRFREDLYYRLNIMEIHIPPLRDRPEDIPLLVEYLVKKHNPELNRNFQRIDDDVIRVLMSLPWKGNVRELDNIIEHTMILAEGDRITVKDLPRAVVEYSQNHPAFTFSLRDALRQFEKQHIARVLNQVNGDRKEGARLLDISLSSLYRKIEELGIGE